MTNSMKNIITPFVALILTASTVFASTTPEVIISNNYIEVINLGAEDFFTAAEFNSKDNLAFTTTKEITLVQIYNEDGDMEFQLPVRSKDIEISMNLFAFGEYKLGFIFEGQSDIHFTQVKIK